MVYYNFMLISMVTSIQQTYSKGVTKLLQSLRYRARPDIVLENYNQVIATERTCPYETNTEKWRELKKRLYENLKNELITPTSNFTLIVLERISLSFTTCTCKCFKDFMLKLNVDYEGIICKWQEVAMKTSSTVDVTNNS